MQLKSALIRPLAIALLLSPIAATAHEPTMTILEPTGIVYLESFPAVVPVKFDVQHAEVKDLNKLEVTVDGSSILTTPEVGNPFQAPGNINSCAVINGRSDFTSCSLLSANQVEVGFNWTVPAAGTYSLLVSVKHKNDTGEDVESVQFLTLTAEYPAPPAVANAYLNAHNPPKGKVRGCIISAIAELHAKDSAYGPKGGPYDENAIHVDVDDFRAACGG